MDLRRLRTEIVRDEGTGPRQGGRFLPYDDATGQPLTGAPKGHLTIGYGRNLDRGLSLAEAEMLLANDLHDTVRDLMRFGWWVKLDGTRQRALANMAFCMGLGAFLTFRQMIAHIAAERYEAAAVCLVESDFGRGPHKARARRLAEMLRRGDAMEEEGA